MTSTLSGIEGISVNIQVPSHDPEYKRIDYGKSCAVALDININSALSKYTMVVQVSKLGKFAQCYWRKKVWLVAMYYKYKEPRDWPEVVTAHIRKAIENCGIRILADEELMEEVKAIPSWCKHPKFKNETVRGLLFCFDGPH